MTANPCTLCELPTPEPPVTDSAVTGVFCCEGCLEIYRQLGDTAPDLLEDRSDRAQQTNPPDAVPEEFEQAYLGIEGMHCATCELFVESLGEQERGIESVDASYATELARVVYDPAAVDENAIMSTLSRYGYQAYPSGEEPGDQDDTVIRFLIGGGFFGMMAMLWYILFLYPTYFGYDPVVEFGTYDFAFVAGHIWLFTSIVLFYTGYPLLRGAFVSLRAGMPNTDLLVSLAAVGAYSYSTLAMFLGRTDLYFDVTIAVILVVTAGTYYETQMKRRATGLLSNLTELRVQEAERFNDGQKIPIEAITPGDELLVRPGMRIPIDGTIVRGRAAIEEALLTGESMPQRKGPGDSVNGGTVVTDEPIIIEAGEDVTSTLDHLVELLWQIQSTKSGAQRLADKLATIFVPLVVMIAFGTTSVFIWFGSPLTSALLVGLTVLIVACPCALGLATPLGVAAGIKSAAANGVVFSTPAIFETASKLDTIVFDKTGTITDGEMTVLDIIPAENESPDSVLEVAAALERVSSHPIATAITSVHSSQIEPEFTETHDRGIFGTVGECELLVGHPTLFDSCNFEISSALQSEIGSIRNTGELPVVVGRERQAIGIIAVGDRERDEWNEVLAELAPDMDVVVLTGDEGAIVDRYRQDTRISTVFEGVKPEAKAETIRRLRMKGMVGMVGDGTNDAPALAEADVGIAMEGGTQLASDAADVIVLGDNLRTVPTAIEIAIHTRRRLRSNLAWAFLYNAIAIPLAVLGLLTPLFAAIAMASSSIVVVLNSSRRIGPKPQSTQAQSIHRRTERDYIASEPV